MLIPKSHRREVYEYLFREGVLVAKKDFNAPKHAVLNVPNLEVGLGPRRAPFASLAARAAR